MEQKKQYGLVAIATLISAAALILFSFIDMVQTLDAQMRFLTNPIGGFLIIALWSGLAIYLVLKGKESIGAIILLLTLLLNRGSQFIVRLLNDSLNFGSVSGFALLIYLGLSVFLLIVLYQERKSIQKISFTCPCKSPYFILMVSLAIFNVIFASVATALFYVILLTIIIGYQEEKMVPVVVLGASLFSVFQLMDTILLSTGNFAINASAGVWIQHILGTTIAVLAGIHYFIPTLFSKYTSKEGTKTEE